MSNPKQKPVCAIVGVGPGNGAAFARKFDAEGYNVALLARTTDYTAVLAQQLKDAKAYACDVTEPNAIANTFAAIRAELGEIDTLIYNAGTGIWKNIEEITPEEFEQSWRINAFGGFLAAKQVIPAMQNKGKGNIIFIGATASRRGGAQTVAFASAKAAQKSLAESMARHLGSQGIHVALVIIDGVVDTPSTRKMMPDKSDEFFIQPDDVADAVLNLVCQKPSAWASELEFSPFGEKW